MIQPTVGRKVWYYPGQNDAEMNKIGDQPFDATVVYVHDNHTVNLFIMDHLAHYHFRASAYLVQPGDDEDTIPENACAKWMPYQINQAEKHSEQAS